MDNLVRREKATEYVLIVVVSFAIAELLTRLFLELTSYPQLSFSIFHISHVIWGGLFMFIAAMLMLIYSNVWVLRLGAVITGAGFALFIDEIGKFITKDYNYFYEPALPLIYIFFLLVFMIYIYLHRQRRETPREMFYDVLDDCKEILDQDLTKIEKEEISKKLSMISKTAEQKEMREFADSLSRYINSIDYQKELKKNWLAQKLSLFREKIKRFKRLHKTIFFVLLALAAVVAVNSIVESVVLGIGVLQSGEEILPIAQDFFRRNFQDMVPKKIDFVLLFTQWLINIFVGATILFGLFSIIMKRNSGISLVKFAIIFSLCSSDIIMLYYSQLPHFGPMLLKLAALGYIMFYKKLYLIPPVDPQKQSG